MVFLVGVAAGEVPHLPDAHQVDRRARACCPTRCAATSATSRRWPEYAPPTSRRSPRSAKTHELQEEPRLGYVALTRARHELVVSSYCWSPTRKGRSGPSPYQVTVKEALEEWGRSPSSGWTGRQGRGQPAHRAGRAPPVARPGTPRSLARRQEAAVRVNAEIARLAAAGGDEPLPLDESGLSDDEAARVAEWDDEMHRLLVGAAGPRPGGRGAAAVEPVRDLGGAAARRPRDAGARPGPADAAQAVTGGPVRHPVPRLGRGPVRPAAAVGLDEVPGRGDAEIDDDTDLQHLGERFNAGAFAERTPYAIEPPFALVLGGQVVRGRIDAVYETERGFLVVDWKTNREQTADPLQLAIYRVAWAELQGVPWSRWRRRSTTCAPATWCSTTTCPAATSSSASSPLVERSLVRR